MDDYHEDTSSNVRSMIPPSLMVFIMVDVPELNQLFMLP